MYKIIGGALIMICSYLLGNYLKFKIKKRIRAFDEISFALRQLRSEIELKMIPIPKAMKQIGEELGCMFFSECSKRIMTTGLSGAFKTSLMDVRGSYCFTSDDIAVISSFSSGLGRSNLDGELRQIDYCIEKLDIHSKNVRKEYEQKQTMYVSVSMLVGALIVLVLM